MIQSVIVGIIFLGALGYLGNVIFKSLSAKSCATGCGKCGVLDLAKIEQQIKAKEQVNFLN